MLEGVRPLTGSFGAEISGIELRSAGQAEAEAIHGALLEHQVLVFPDQHVSPDRLAAFARRLGEIEPPHPGLEHVPGNPEVALAELEDGKGCSGYDDLWRPDATFDLEPPKVTILHAVELPASGCDTSFINLNAAFDALTDTMRQTIEGREALHDGIPAARAYLLDPAIEDGAERLRRFVDEHPGFVHPLVRRHPETGRHALFVDRAYTIDIMGVTSIESRNMLNVLFAHIERPDFRAHWHWSQGDVAMWDNRSTLHQAARNDGQERRTWHRVTIKGERPQP